MSESTEVPVKANDKSPSTRVFLIASMLGGAFFMGLFVNLSLQELRSHHFPMGMYREEIIRRDKLEYQFTAYMKKFGKIYNKSEFQLRLKNFKESVSEIQKLNEAHNGTAKFGFTKFSDMSKEEFHSAIQVTEHYGREDFNVTCNPPVLQESEYDFNETWKLPSKFDWRDQGVVAPVLSQGRCLSCWAHCVIGIMESMVMIKNLPQSNQYSHLSIQELIDCSTYTDGCNPGNPVSGLAYLCNNYKPIVPASAYPLTNKKRDCKSTPNKGVLLSKYMVENNVKPSRIAEIVARYGPVTTIVNSKPWRYYVDGVIGYHCSGSHEDLDHVVQVVGYNLEAPVPYFILRNSWGTDWGDHGYLYTAMNGICGVGSQITYVDVDIV